MADITTHAPALTPRFAVAVTFLCFGIGIGLWSGSVPVVTRNAGLSPEELGAALVGFGLAGIAGFSASGRIAVHVSLKRRLLALLAATGVCLAVLMHASSPLMLYGCLFLFSFLAASVDLVMNAEGVAVEREAGRPILIGFHAMSSVGLAAGAILGSQLSVRYGVFTTAFAATVAYAVAFVAVARLTPDRGPTEMPSAASWFRPSSAFLLLSLVVGIVIAIEISTVNFSAKALAAIAPDMAAWAGGGALVYAALQAAMRFAGDALRARLGDQTLLLISVLAAAAGLSIVSVSSSFAMGVLGFALIGLGTACVVPVGFALAPSLAPSSAASALSILILIGAPFRIVAPMAYGAIAGVSSYAVGYVTYLALAAAAVVLSLLLLSRPFEQVKP